MRNKFLQQKGFSLLPTVLVTSIIIAEVGIALTFVMYMANSASYSSRLLQEAYSCAKSGIDDALLRLIRNKDFYSTEGYNFTIGRCNAVVEVEKDVPAQYNSQITVTASVFNRQKKLRAIVSIDPDAAEIFLVSLQEI
ncbi:MAG: hypothetical protein N2692_02860 [Patescibacteria group bacterium]|nr:hypothetical protein [Patescibacteria group bacterium]